MTRSASIIRRQGLFQEMMDVSLRRAPVDDPDFEVGLADSTKETLMGALIWLRARPKYNTSRILAIQRELRRR
jgi:hypothetical protein